MINNLGDSVVCVYMRILPLYRESLKKGMHKKHVVDIVTNYKSLSYALSRGRAIDYILCNSSYNKMEAEDILEGIIHHNVNIDMNAIYGELPRKMSINIWVAFSKQDFILIDLTGMSPMDKRLNAAEFVRGMQFYNFKKKAIIIDEVYEHFDEMVFSIKKNNVNTLLDIL